MKDAERLSFFPLSPLSPHAEFGLRAAATHAEQRGAVKLFAWESDGRKRPADREAPGPVGIPVPSTGSRLS